MSRPPRKIPTKVELLRLQKLYRTDKKIADVLGNGVTEHLVGYWRRKKGIPRYSFPKFSEKDISEVWDRFGDDYRAGMELGISKAAFYNWRRRYKITKKPEALKLEQLSLELHTPDEKHRRKPGTGHQTIAQKILAVHCERNDVPVGETVGIEPDVVLMPSDGGAVIRQFLDSGTTYVWNPNRIIVPLDGTVVDSRCDPADAYKTIRDFSRRQQIRHFFDIGQGCPPQVVIEKGLVLPGQLGLGADSRATVLGSIGALSCVIDSGSLSVVLADGSARLTVPETVRVIISGKPPRGVFTRDVSHYVAARLLKDNAAENRVVEFYGAGVERMAVSERITLCHAACGAGAIASLCPFDSTTRRYINPRARRSFTPAMADRNADYATEYTFEVNKMKPIAADYRDIREPIPVEQMDGVPIQQVYIGGIANGRFDDLKIAADILKGKRANPDVRLFIHPVSRPVYLEALKKGLLRVFIEAGAVVFNPGGPAAIRHLAPIAAEEKGLTTLFEFSAENAPGDMYQVSPATAAASALTGQITDPAGYVKA